MTMASSSFDTLNVIYCLFTYRKYMFTHLPHIVNHQECFKNIITTVIFSRNHQPRRPRLPPFFMLMPHGFVRCNFIGHHGWNGWESTNQPPSALACDVMPFCVDANMTTSEVVCHLLINCPLFLTRDGRSTSATRCQQLMVSGLETMSTRILGHCQMLGSSRVHKV